MDIGSIFLTLALLIFVVLFISRPILEQRSMTAAGTMDNMSTLLAQRDQVVASIQELDDDYNLGKIPLENYEPRRLTLLQTGAEILRQIDEQQPTFSTAPAPDRIEEAILARRNALDSSPSAGKKNGNAVPPVPDDDLEQRIALRRRSVNEKAGGFCPKCGKPVHASDRFCPKCGATLA
jgi:hypothetical protein